MDWLRNWRDGTLVARPAAAPDRPAVSALMASAWRRHGITALEEQVALLNGGASAVAFSGTDMIGFLGLDVRQPAEALMETWADVSMAASAGRAPAGKTLGALLDAAMPALRARRVTALMALTAEGWLKSGLAENTFSETDRVVSYARDGRQPPPGAARPSVLRAARPTDAEAVLALNAAAFEPIWRYDDAATLAWLMTSDHAILAEQAGRPVGFALTTCAGAGQYAQLIRVAVHPEAQGRGIGRQLVADAICFGIESGAAGVSLNTQASNGVARRLYSSLGFRSLPEPLAVMVRSLL
jgi:ribosomal-protein-alanine N-acetyltransferase